MKIKTRLYGNLVLGIGLAIVFALILVWSSYQIDSELEESETANKLVRETTDLIMIGEEYLVYRYPRTILQWKATYDTTMAVLKDMKKSAESDRIKENLVTLNKSFLKLKENFFETRSHPEERLSQAYLVLDERLSGQMRVLSRNIIGNTLKLSMEATDQTRRIEQKDNVVLFVFLGLFILLTAASLFFTIKKITMSLAGLERDANIINNGNLKHKISTSIDLPNGPRDEIEELSQSFSNMTGRLVKTIEKLETEVAKRTEAEDKLKKAHDGLEKKVEERTEELAKANDKLRKEIDDRKYAEEALRQREELHKDAQRVAHIGHWELYPEIGTPVWSDEIFRIFGLNPQEGEPSFTDHETHLHPDDWPLLNKAVTLASTEGTPFNITFRIVRSDGEIRWMHSIGTTTKDEKGKVTKVFGTAQDITEHKQAEEALRESEERLNAILDATTETIVLFDSKGIVRAANQIVCERLETTKEEFIGRRIYDFFPPSVAEGRRQKWNEVFDTGKPVNFEDSRKGMMFEQRAYPILDDKGQVEMVVAFANDKTDSKLAKESLRESEEKFRLISEQSLLAIGIIQNGHILYANETYSEITGYSLEEIYGWEPYGYAGTVYKDDLPFVMEQSRKKQAGNMDVITNYQFRGFTKAKEIVWWDLYSRTITYQERSADLFTFVDITERIESEKEREALQAKLQHAQKMEAIGTLAGGVAHDLNNILGGLVSYPELLLLQLPEGSPLRKSILTIQKSGEKAAAVVQDLLTLARRGVVVTEVVDLNDVIAEYLKSPEHEKLQSYHPGVHIETRLEADILNILGSSTHLSKTAMNLISNAAEAMPEGGNLIVSTENRYIDRPIKGYDDVREGDYVVLTISDTGTGIASDDLDKIFEPFYTKKKMGRSGTGLGMAVVWGTVKDHNGYIDVQSTEGKGTTFTLYFSATREKLSEDKSNLAIKSYSGNGESILVIDDVEEQRNIASGMLKELGYSVVSVSSGEKAVEYLKTNKVDLLLLDMIMDPGMDGLDTYKKILKLHPGQKAIIASGFSETGRVKEVQNLGAGAYIRKPLLLEKIGIAVKKELEK